jgi:galactokinase
MTTDSSARARDDFERRFGRAPVWIATAPGRVNLIGEHVDYNDGFVLPIAIGRRTAIAAAPNGSDVITIYSEATNDSVQLNVARALSAGPRGHWANFPKGVLANFIELTRKPPAGFDAVVHSDVPLGAGLSSSAAFETAMVTLLEAASDVTIDPVRKAEICQRAEHTFVGVPCGIMDSFIATLARAGHALLLDCRTRDASWVPLLNPEVVILIINTNVRHELSSSEYPLRQSMCRAAAAALGVGSLRDVTATMLHAPLSMDELTFRCARHVVGEIARTVEAAECLRRCDWTRFGQLMYQSHESLKKDYGVSCRELDTVVEVAHHIRRGGGMYGCRMTGGGFGGCAVALIETVAADAIVSEISAEYFRRTGIRATLFASEAAEGARLLTL